MEPQEDHAPSKDFDLATGAFIARREDALFLGPPGMHLLERALSTLPHIAANTIIADESGIHWRTIHRTAELVKYVSEHSSHSKGTFNFTATAMLKPFAPFFLGSYHIEDAC